MRTKQHQSVKDHGINPCSVPTALLASKQAQAFGYTERPVSW